MKLRNPLPTVDIIIRMPRGIVLIKRKNKPYGWAIPGGFIDYGESVESAARREAKEETNLTLSVLKQFHVYSSPRRDPRFHTLSVVFTARGKGRLKARDDAAEIGVFSQCSLPSRLAFDHKRILNDYFRKKFYI
jgi:ADP-ribose pyrophosphatase YjhB (NUDIX family)